MAANKIVHEPGKYFDCTSMHGKWCTITMRKRKKEKVCYGHCRRLV